MVTDVVWSLLITSVSGVIFGILTVLYKSKCKHIECCGLVIDRDIEDKMKIDIDANHVHNSLANSV